MTEVASPPASTASAPSGDVEKMTIFDDKLEFGLKHPLASKWTLWYTKPPSGKGDNWAELLREVITFDSVEEFWGIYNNIPHTSELPQKADFNLFRSGIRPEWEDVQNKHGGRWAFQFKDKKLVDIDKLWLNIMLAAIGETLEGDGDGEVMGVVVNVRKGFYRIGLWTRTIGKPVPGGGDGENAGGKGRTTEKGKQVLMGLGKRFKEVMGLRADEIVEFSGHAEAQASGSTRAKAKFSV